MAGTFLNIFLLSLCLVHDSLADAGSVRAIRSQAELDVAISQYDSVMVKYESPWCSHCKKMQPAYQEAADFLIEHNILLATKDCTEWIDIRTAMCDGINSYPTMLVYRGRSESVKYDNPKYGGGREARDFISYMINGTYPTDIPIASTTRKLYLAPTKTPPAPPPNPSPDSSSPNVVFVANNGTSAIVKLALPGLTDTMNWAVSSALILEFSFDETGKHLIMNGEMLALQVPNPSVPASLKAAQVHTDWSLSTPEYDLTQPDHQPLLQVGKFFPLALDYELYARHRDDPNIIYYNYHPTIYLNLIGCRTLQPPSYEPMDFLLDSMEQKIVEINLDQMGSGSSEDPNRTYRISSVKLQSRPQDYRVPRPNDQACSRWSWRCSDVGDPPWYRFVWRDNFDKNGRIGSLRWRYRKLHWTGITLLGSMLSHILSGWLALYIPLAAVAFCCYVLVRAWRRKRKEAATTAVDENRPDGEKL